MRIWHKLGSWNARCGLATRTALCLDPLGLELLHSVHSDLLHHRPTGADVAADAEVFHQIGTVRTGRRWSLVPVRDWIEAMRLVEHLLD